MEVQAWMVGVGIGIALAITGGVWWISWLVQRRREAREEIDPTTVNREAASRRLASFRSSEPEPEPTPVERWPTTTGRAPARSRGPAVSDEVAVADRILSRSAQQNTGPPAGGRHATPPDPEEPAADPLAFLSLEDEPKGSTDS